MNKFMVNFTEKSLLTRIKMRKNKALNKFIIKSINSTKITVYDSIIALQGFFELVFDVPKIRKRIKEKLDSK